MFADAGYDVEWVHEFCREDWKVNSLVQKRFRLFYHPGGIGMFRGFGNNCLFGGHAEPDHDRHALSPRRIPSVDRRSSSSRRPSLRGKNLLPYQYRVTVMCAS